MGPGIIRSEKEQNEQTQYVVLVHIFFNTLR
jgi:hypothetical protein